MNEQIYSSDLAADVALLRKCLNKTLADMHKLIHHPDNAIPVHFYDDDDKQDAKKDRCEEKKSEDIPTSQRPEKIKSAALETYGQDTPRYAGQWDPAELQSRIGRRAQIQASHQKKKNPTPNPSPNLGRIKAHFARLEKQFHLIMTAQKAVAEQALREDQFRQQIAGRQAAREEVVTERKEERGSEQDEKKNPNDSSHVEPVLNPTRNADIAPENPWRALSARMINPHKRE